MRRGEDGARGLACDWVDDGAALMWSPGEKDPIEWIWVRGDTTVSGAVVSVEGGRW